MPDAFKAVRISDKVYWVGAVDWAIGDFHGYRTGRGTTYNAYLIMTDRITLIDTVKAPFMEECLARIASVTDPSNIDIIVSNHSEMDHTGALPAMLHQCRPKAVYASKMGVKAINAHFDLDHEITAVADGQTLDIGGGSLTFAETRMLHWPDSMITWFDSDGVLFSQDGFGMHLASPGQFADELEESILRYEAAKYYANILMPYSPLVPKLLSRLDRMNLDVKILAPDHGPMWRNDIGKILAWYDEWSSRKTTAKAVIVYDTMWGSTEKMAKSIADGLYSENIRASVMKLRKAHRSDIMTELLDADALLVGSPTLNNRIFPTMADFLTYAGGLKPAGLIGASFGSYGWSGEAQKQLDEILVSMKVDLVHDNLRCRYVPGNDVLGQCREFGRDIAKAIKNRHENT